MVEATEPHEDSSSAETTKKRDIQAILPPANPPPQQQPQQVEEAQQHMSSTTSSIVPSSTNNSTTATGAAAATTAATTAESTPKRPKMETAKKTWLAYHGARKSRVGTEYQVASLPSPSVPKAADAMEVTPIAPPPSSGSSDNEKTNTQES